ncbi:hypothetical protein HD806DRAFT_368847 [Xylariaceae sp. AK1471]|nr:hypothetical protein HD806DRAFT_368847 [Xylariaceae sp. AK1471]
MPTYLCHGFRWHRKSVRYYIAKHDIEDGATEWIVAPRSETALIDHFYSSYEFLPPTNPSPSRKASSPAYRKHHHAPSNDSSYVSRTSSSEYHGSEDPGYPNGNGTKATSRSTSRQSSKSLSRPRTSGRDETTHSASLPAPPLLSPSSITTKNSDYFDNVNDNSSAIKLLEEFDPKDESRASGPWAYVADHVVRVTTSVSIADEMFRYEARMKRDPNKAMHGASDEYGRKVLGASSRKAGWLEKLRDQLQRGESIRWYIVVCGDEERYNPTGFDEEEELLEEEEDEYEEEECEGSSSGTRSQDRAWLRQSQSTQSTEATTMTGSSVISGGFEYRIPELAGLAVRTPTVTPERKKNKLLAPPLSQKEFASIPLPPPPKSPLPPELASKMGQGSHERPKTARSTIGLRKLFSRQKSETVV